MEGTFLLLLLLTAMLLSLSLSLPAEPMTSSPPTLLLLGDSVLANDAYATPSVAEHLRRTHARVRLAARDGARIRDVYRQPQGPDNDDMYIVLSVGGNDMLRGTQEDDAAFFRAYRELVTRLRSLYPHTPLLLCTLYCPPAMRARYETRVRAWNRAVRALAPPAYIIDLFPLLGQPADIVARIEPSAQGGAKIAHAILSALPYVGHPPP